MKQIYNNCIFILMMLAGCSMLENSISLNHQNIFFEVEYENYAWGYQHRGFYINNDGEVHKYEYEFNAEPWQSNPDNYYSEAELLKKYAPNDSLTQTISLKVVAEKIELIIPAMQSKYSDSARVAADAGALRYICYYYDSVTKEYLQIILAQEGDWEFKKESEAADGLIKWLKYVQLTNKNL